MCFVFSDKDKKNRERCVSFLYFYFSYADKRLYQVSDPLFAVARKEVDDGDFYHGVAPRLLLHGSACHAHNYLCSQCRIVDAHIELEQLILRFTGNSLASQIYTVSHIEQCVYAGHKFYMCLVVHEVRVCLDGCGYFFKLVYVFQFDL